MVRLRMMSQSPPSIPGSRPETGLPARQIVKVVLLGLVMLLLVWHITWRVHNAHVIARIEQAAQARGEPLNWSQLEATYGRIPNESNAYVALEAIWQEEDPVFWNAFKAGQRPLPTQTRIHDPTNVPFLDANRSKVPPGTRLSGDQVEATEKFLRSKQDHFAEVREALQRPDFRAPIVFEQTYAATLPWLPLMKRGAMLLRIESAMAAEKNQLDQALDSLEAIARLARYLEKDPLLISQLVRLSIGTLAVNGAERILSQTQLNEQQLKRLGGILSGLQASDGFRRAMLGERAMMFGFLDAPYATLHASDATDDSASRNAAGTSANGIKLMSAVGLIGADKRLSGETFEKLLRCADNPDFATNDQVEAIFTNLDREARRFPPKVFTAMLMPAFARSGQKFAQAEALRLCAELAVQIEMYRLKHEGALPKQLDDLGPSPKDPFDGQPLRYQKTDRGYLLYSVGPDHKDNGGLLEPTKSGKGLLPPEKDIGFRVEKRTTD